MKQLMILFGLALFLPAAHAGSYDAVLAVGAGVVCGSGDTLESALGDLNVKLADQEGVTLSGGSGVKLQVKAPFSVSAPVFQSSNAFVPVAGPVAYKGRAATKPSPDDGVVIPIPPGGFGPSVCVTVTSMGNIVIPQKGR